MNSRYKEQNSIHHHISELRLDHYPDYIRRHVTYIVQEHDDHPHRYQVCQQGKQYQRKSHEMMQQKFIDFSVSLSSNNKALGYLVCIDAQLDHVECLDCEMVGIFRPVRKVPED